MTDSPELEKAKVNLETAQIPWLELQRFFAAGLAIAVADDLDLVDVAYQFAADNEQQVENWLKSHRVMPVSDQQAMHWIDNDAEVWAVVVKPWVLVQEARDNQ
jgi:hypothetical protein